VSLPRPRLAHLARLTDDTGLFEHALGAVPRRTDGWCTDDNGRGLAVVSRSQEPEAERLAATYLSFLAHAHEGGGRFRLRLAYDRRWTADPASDDANARALFGLAVAWARGSASLRWTAGKLFGEAAAFRSEHPRAMAHAAIGAAELVAADPDHPEAWQILTDAARTLPRPSADEVWSWPAPRLTYGNALLPEALIATGEALGDDVLLADGLRLLEWLLEEGSLGDHFSFAPTGGRGPGDPRPAFDQQPIEAATVAGACARAHEVTGDPVWLSWLDRAVSWVCGVNDAGVALLDITTGGGYDGLIPGGVNRNEGAESTLAVLTVLQIAHDLLPPERIATFEVRAPAPDQRAEASAASR
jgi:hypothetical protein